MTFDERVSSVRHRRIASTRSSASVARVIALACFGPLVIGNAAMAQNSIRPGMGALVSEVRRTFTLEGKPIPPEIFRDMGDGDLADSGSIWVTVDLKAAVGSNLYADDISHERDWVIQKKPGQGANPGELTTYKFIGATENGLLVVIATYNGGGSGMFYTLHILDLTLAQAFDSQGKRYERLNLTGLRSHMLGDRWDGTVSISENSVRIDTIRKGPADRGPPSSIKIAAERP